MNIKSEIRKKLKARPKKTHKGDVGRVFILAGSKGLAGAAHLAGMGCMRSGAGLVTVGVPEKIYNVVARREAEVMVKPFPSTSEGTLSLNGFSKIQTALKPQGVLALGPGLSQNKQTQKLIHKLIQKTKQPLVIDADGLNAIQGKNQSVLKFCKGRAILTPHPGEFRRLFGGSVPKDDAGRQRVAKAAAKKCGAIVILKGHHTVIASPDGKVAVNTTGNPGMATGGSGDVLTGIIAALIGQKLSLWDAARFGVYLHGLAGDLAAKKVGEISLVASDILQHIPQAFRKAT